MWEYFPGPGPDDFRCDFTTLDEAVDAILNFHFGTQTIIDGWIFPFHRHPELQRERVSSLLHQAVMVTAEQFRQIEDEHNNRYWRALEVPDLPMKTWWDQASDFARDELSGKDDVERIRIICELENAGKLPKRPPRRSFSHYEWAMRTEFLPIQHSQDQTKSLRLRRDLEEIYVIALT
jgi:hypothetical protein